MLFIRNLETKFSTTSYCGRAETLLVLSAEDCAGSAGVGAKGGCYVSRRERCG
jgi:hypothetical protein